MPFVVDLFFNYLKLIRFEDKLPNGESRKDFFYRSINAINNILKQNERPLIVANGRTYWSILYALNFPDDHINNCQCFLFAYSDGWQKIAIHSMRGVSTKAVRKFNRWINLLPLAE